MEKEKSAILGHKHKIERFQILSLDGGGIKGLFSAAVLAHIEEDLNIKITDHFDLLVGTSTGGIIALGLGMGMRPLEILRFYVEKGPMIFGNGLITSLRHLWRNKHNSEGLEKALKDCFGDTLFFACRKRIVIPSYNIGEDDVYLFKTPHHERLTRDYKFPVWKIAMATCAAPTYFPSFRNINHIRLVDGGVWANNPTMVGIVEAVSMLKVPLESIGVFSLGTTSEIKGRSRILDHGGRLQWAVEAVDVIMRGQSIGANTQAIHLLGNEKVLRVDPKVPDGLFALDRMKEEELLSKAAHESRHIAPFFKNGFTSHVADEFKPFYQV